MDPEKCTFKEFTSNLLPAKGYIPTTDGYKDACATAYTPPVTPAEFTSSTWVERKIRGLIQ
jgi:hypothetical protein